MIPTDININMYLWGILSHFKEPSFSWGRDGEHMLNFIAIFLQPSKFHYKLLSQDEAISSQ